MSQRICHHVNPAGVFCGGSPVNKREYCFWHMQETGRRMKAARARARSERVFIQLPVLDDLHAVQVGLMQLAEAIAHGEIDYHSGRLLLSVLRLAASNLKSEQGWRQREPDDSFADDANVVIEDPGFERDYGLPKDFDLSVPPEVAFPPPQPSVAAAQDQPGRERDTHRARPSGASHRPKQDGMPQAPQQSPAVGTPVPVDATAPASPTVAAGRKPPHSAGDVASASRAASRIGGS